MLPLLAGLAGLALMGNPLRSCFVRAKVKARKRAKKAIAAARRARGKAASERALGALAFSGHLLDHNPSKRSGSKGTTPSGAGARLAKWRWHHNPSDLIAKVKHAAQLWRTGRFQTLEDAVDAAGLPMRTYIVERVQDEIDDLAEGKRRALVNPGRYARLDAKAVAKARLNIRSCGHPRTVWPAVKAQGAAARARRTLTYGQRSRLSKRIAFEYQKAIKAKRRRSR